MGKSHKSKKKNKKKNMRVVKAIEVCYKNMPQNVEFTENDPIKRIKNIPSRLKAKVRVLHERMKTKIKIIKSKFDSLYQSNKFRIAVIVTLGVLLVGIGVGFCFVSRMEDVPIWSKEGPMIWIACDSPGIDMQVFAFTNREGVTRLRIQIANIIKELLNYTLEAPDTSVDTKAKGEDGLEKTDEFHIWILLLSADVPVGWSIDERMNNVENYEILYTNLVKTIAKKTGTLEGCTQCTLFRITFDEESTSSMAEITISESKGHAIYRANGIVSPRLPEISIWVGGTAIEHILEPYGVSGVEDSNRYVADPDTLKLSINDRPMFWTHLNINTTYEAIRMIDLPDAEIELVYPEPEENYPSLRWTGEQRLCPIVRYRDKKWEIVAERNNLIGGLLIGFGISIFIALKENNREN